MPQAAASSTQQHVNIAQIKEGVVITRTGDLRMIVEVTPVNFALRSEEDQNVIIGQYQSFLNSLTFPIQILIQSRRLDLHPYLQELDQVVGRQPNELLTLQATEYIEFIKRLTTLVNIMDKKLYVIVPFTPPPSQKVGGITSMFTKKQLTVSFTPKQFADYREQLGERVTTVETGLGALGLKTTRLTSRQLIELYYYVYNPEEAVEERLTEQVEEIAAPIIRRAHEPTEQVIVPTQDQKDPRQKTYQRNGSPQSTPLAPQPANPGQGQPNQPTIENKATIMNETLSQTNQPSR